MNESRLHKGARRWLRFAREDLTEAEAMLKRGDFQQYGLIADL